MCDEPWKFFGYTVQGLQDLYCTTTCTDNILGYVPNVIQI